MKHRYVVAILKSEDDLLRFPMPTLKSAETFVSALEQPAVVIVEEVKK